MILSTFQPPSVFVKYTPILDSRLPGGATRTEPVFSTLDARFHSVREVRAKNGGEVLRPGLDQRLESAPCQLLAEVDLDRVVEHRYQEGELALLCGLAKICAHTFASA